MAINPADVTTVQVGELPPLALSLSSIIPHEIGGVLHKSTVQDLVNFINGQSEVKQYELKLIRNPTSAYITDNFDMAVSPTTGLGKAGGLWEGWAICNGNNGTDNLDGQTLIGQGATYPTVGTFLGSKDAVVVSHVHKSVANVDATGNFDPTLKYTAGIRATGNGYALQGTATAPGHGETNSAGESGAGKNMQPSMVILIIMKL